MNRIVLSFTIALVCIGSLEAQGPPATEACTNKSLQGTFGLQISGTRPAPEVLPGFGILLPGSIESVIGVVTQVFDGNGNFTQVDNVKGSLSGIAFDRPGSGTYTVNPDCTGTFRITAGTPFPVVNRFVIVDGGKEFLSVVVSPQAVMVMARGRKT